MRNLKYPNAKRQIGMPTRFKVLGLIPRSVCRRKHYDLIEIENKIDVLGAGKKREVVMFI